MAAAKCARNDPLPAQTMIRHAAANSSIDDAPYIILLHPAGRFFSGR